MQRSRRTSSATSTSPHAERGEARREQKEGARRRRASRRLNRVRGPLQPFFALLGGRPSALAVVRTGNASVTTTVLVGFGADSTRLDPNDIDQVRAALRMARRPGGSSGHRHDWMSDPHSRETWLMQRPRQLTRYLEGQQASRARCTWPAVTRLTSGPASSTARSRAPCVSREIRRTLAGGPTAGDARPAG
ncbi:acetyltransferase [Pseudonocardia sp. MCCB 268]|nr:acetyltransferase [Pseudonocardia cytotoxica]